MTTSRSNLIALSLLFILIFGALVWSNPIFHKKSISDWKELAVKGDVKAGYFLGISYWKGIGVKQNYEEAVKWLRHPAEMGVADAQVKMGVAYDEGKGVTIDRAEGMKWTYKAAAQGNKHAQFNIGHSYWYGESVKTDKKEAMVWFEKSAKQDFSDAQLMLGTAYFGLRKGHDQNEKEAIRWLTLAGGQGNLSAQYLLGLIFFDKKDYEKGYIWFDILLLSGEKTINFAGQSVNLSDLAKLKKSIPPNISEKLSNNAAFLYKHREILTCYSIKDSKNAASECLKGTKYADQSETSHKSQSIIETIASLLTLLF